VHPQQVRGVAGLVGGRLHEAVDPLHASSDAVGQLGRSVDHRVDGLEGAQQALERVVLEVAVLVDAGGDMGMGELQEQRPPGAEHDRRLFVDPADHRVAGEGRGHDARVRRAGVVASDARWSSSMRRARRRSSAAELAPAVRPSPAASVIRRSHS